MEERREALPAHCVQEYPAEKEEENYMKSSNIGGQAVLEGIMMKHKSIDGRSLRRLLLSEAFLTS